MKKLCALFSLCFTLCFLSGCISISQPLDIYIQTEDITAIEVYYFDEPVYWNYQAEQWEYKIRAEDDESYETIPYTNEPIACVATEDYAAFVADAEALPFTVGIPLIPMAIDPTRAFSDYTVKIKSETDYLLITNSGGGSIAYCEEETWYQFLKKYIGEEAFERPDQTQSDERI